MMLAWRQTWRRLRGSIAALFGLAGAMVLVLIQLGFQGALTESAVRLHRALDGEVVVVARGFHALRDIEWFDRASLPRVLAHPEVIAVKPLTAAPVVLRHVRTDRLVTILGLGIDPIAPALARLPPEAGMLTLPGNVLFDSRAKPSYGDIAGRLRAEGSLRVVTGAPSSTLQPTVTVVGLHAIGANILVDGTLLMSLDTMAGTIGRDADRITFGVLRLAPGADAARVARDVTALLPPRLHALPLRDLVRLEMDYWLDETPIGFIFSFGVMVGYLVCAIAIWQVLGQVMEENLPEYAVLKTMGYPPGFFGLVIIATAQIHAVAALPIATAMAWALYRICADATLLDMTLTPERLVFVGLGAMGISTVTGALAWRRLGRADPAALL